MNITYEKNGDYLIPNLISDPEPEGELRKFGLMRRHYLKEHRSGIYQAMLLSGKLKEHLKEKIRCFGCRGCIISGRGQRRL